MEDKEKTQKKDYATDRVAMFFTPAKFTEEDVGKTVTITTAEGTYIEQEVVKTYCQFCGEEMIGTIRAAGGFLAAHDIYHKAEAPLAQMETMR
jgi:hypothetical protein